MKLRKKDRIKFLINIGLIVIVSGINYLCWIHYYGQWTLMPFLKNGNILMGGLFSVIYIVFNNLNGGFHIGEERTRDILFSNTMALIFANIVMYLQISLLAHAFEKLIPLLGAMICEFILIALWLFVSGKSYYFFCESEKIIYFYQDITTELIFKMRKMAGVYSVIEEIDVAKDWNYKILLECDSILIDQNVSGKKKTELMMYAYSRQKQVLVSPRCEDVLLYSAKFNYLEDEPFYQIDSIGISVEQKMIKRLFDIVLSSILIILTSPFMLLTVLAIKLEDGGSALYSQKRLTEREREFQIYKFRSMIVDAEKDGKAVLMTKNDSRVTKVGEFIRKTRLDELPQLFNIFKGEMSFVGPRPERPELAEEIYKTLPEFRLRLKCQAGLTGYAQVMGKYNTTVRKKLIYDLDYIQNYSLLFDIKIMILTVKTIFRKSATEGVE